MKKSLIALAVLSTIAGSAVAQSSVTVYGRFDQSYNNVDTKNSSGTATATNTGFDGGIGGSRLGFRGTEDLGGGLKANFVIEFGVDAGENTGVGATRLGFADISSSAGTFRMGRQVSPTKAVADSYNALGNNTNFTPGDVNALTGYDNRISNAITYLTPTMNGLSAQFMFSNAENTTAAGVTTSLDLLNGSAAADGAAVYPALGAPGPVSTTNAGYRVTRQGEVKGAGINYTVGKFAVAYAMQDQTSTTADVDATNEITIAAATYDFGFLKAHLDQSTRKIKNAGVTVADRKVMTLGVTAPVGAKLALAAQYFDGDRNAGTGTSLGVFNTATDSAADYSGYKVRATYALSKRTGLYGQVGKTETKEAAAKTTVEGYNLGMYHTF
jgi:predicted porin